MTHATSLTDVLTMLYAWLKAGHIIFIVFWMAGLFMYPRLLVYWAEAPAGSREADAMAVRARRLSRIIMAPSLILVWILGLALAFSIHAWDQGWLHAKLLLVLLLSAFHGWIVGVGRKMATGARPVTNRTLRLLNEVPGIALVLIVILVVVKPF